MLINGNDQFNLLCLAFTFMAYSWNCMLKHLTANFIVHWYFNDFLASIILLASSNILLRFENKGIYSIKGIFIFILIASILWEYIIPIFKKKSISDPFDVLTYFIGATMYYIMYRFM